jgi:hypothetical protein
LNLALSSNGRAGFLFILILSEFPVFFIRILKLWGIISLWPPKLFIRAAIARFKVLVGKENVLLAGNGIRLRNKLYKLPRKAEVLYPQARL